MRAGHRFGRLRPAHELGMSTLTPDMRAARLAAINARAAAVPSAGWDLDGPDSHFYGNGDSDYVQSHLITTVGDRDAVVVACPPVYPHVNEKSFYEWTPTAEANMVFIAHSRDDIAWLLAQLAASEAQVRLLEAQLPGAAENTTLVFARHQDCADCDGSGMVMSWGGPDDCPNLDAHMALAAQAYPAPALP